MLRVLAKWKYTHLMQPCVANKIPWLLSQYMRKLRRTAIFLSIAITSNCLRYTARLAGISVTRDECNCTQAFIGPWLERPVGFRHAIVLLLSDSLPPLLPLLNSLPMPKYLLLPRFFILVAKFSAINALELTGIAASVQDIQWEKACLHLDSDLSN